MKSLITKLIIFTIAFSIIAVPLSYVNIKYLHPYSAAGEYCMELRSQGYFEDKYDTAAHLNCTSDLKEGPSQCNWVQVMMLNEETQQECYTHDYDSYDHECEKELDMKEFEKRCTWGSLGWMALALFIMIWVGLLGIGVMYIAIIVKGVKEDEA